jgi:hypothetical protein
VRNELWRRARAVPSLDLRFADSKSLVDATTGANLVTFTRASSGTYVGSDGLIKTAATNEPRFDHNPTTGESLGLLVEEQRTNLLLQSEDFSTAWAVTRASITTDSITAPSGAVTADKLIEDTTATNTHFAAQTVSVSAGSAYTFSVYAKAAERSFVQLVLNGQFTSVISAIFDLSSGAVGTTTGVPTTNAQALGNGWWRFSITQTANATGVTSAQVRTANVSNTATYTGDGTSGIYIWGAMLEAGSFPTSYIPTTTAAVTRSADVASISGSNFSSWYRQDEGTVFAASSSFGATNSNRRIAFATDGTTSNRFGLLYNSLNNPQIVVSSAGTITANPSVALAGATYAIAAAYKLDDYAISAAASIPSTDTSGALPVSVNQLSIGSQINGEPVNGTIKRLCFWPQRLSNSTLQTLTQ